jgi:hypothetical protein
MYLTSANVQFLSIFAFNEINKLRIISEAQNSDSPRLHHQIACIYAAFDELITTVRDLVLIKKSGGQRVLAAAGGL